MNGLEFECQKMALKQDSTGFVLTIRVHPDELPEELFRDFVGARYAIAMVRIGDDESVVNYENRTKSCAMLCKNELFWDFLTDNLKEPIQNEENAISGIYHLLNITSRTELNGNAQAKKRYDNLIKEYDEYSRKKVGI